MKFSKLSFHFGIPAKRMMHFFLFVKPRSLIAVQMNSGEQTKERRVKRICWRKDLEASRSVGSFHKGGFAMVLEWFENFRLRVGLEAGRKAAIRFWKLEVLGKEVTREDWQLEQWGERSSPRIAAYQAIGEPADHH